MSNQKPSLLLVGAFPPPGIKVFGGIITVCKTLLDEGLAKHFELIPLDSTQRSVPPPNILQRLVDSLSRIYKYLRLVILRRPDAIIIFVSTGFSFLEKSLFAAFGRFCGSHVLFSPRGGRLMDDCRRNKLYGLFVQFMLRFPDVLLCQGEVWRGFFIEEMNLPPEKCLVFKNWTATKSLLQIGASRNYNSQERLRILFIGWIYRTKGIYELIDAFSMLYSRFLKLELVIAGEGEASIEARKYVLEKGLSTRVRFLGWIAGMRKLQELTNATLFCLPSHVEGLPNTVIEAMATGLPVVVTPVGEITDVICHGENGMISPVGDSHALALRIEQLIKNPGLRERLGRCAYLTAAREHNSGQAVLKLTKLIYKLIQ